MIIIMILIMMIAMMMMTMMMIIIIATTQFTKQIHLKSTLWPEGRAIQSFGAG